MPVPRILFACAIAAAALAAAVPASAYSLVSLAPQERDMMLSTCGKLGGNDRALCRSVVEDHRVIANYKRSCLEAMTLLLQGTAWSRVKSLPATLTCRAGLAQAGYPVKDIMHRLTGAQ
ncbi:MAG TPA: hypothetical protein VN655_05250 [Pseudolabrys sp.]|nr:hypothetical protein [Pseudolabrys sp.]